MNKIMRVLLSSIMVIVLIVLGLVFLSDLTERKESKNKFAEFYEQEQPFDVLFFGSSHVLNGIYPMELWSNFGIVSYNMAGHGNRMATNYWMVRNALEYTKPKLVVIDCYLVSLEDKISSEEQLHISTDSIPFSRTKVEMIYDLIEKKERRLDFLWKFSTYHNRWSDLNMSDFVPNTSVEKGAEPNISVAIPDNSISIDSFEEIKDDNLGVQYLCKIIEECQKQNIEVLLTYIPFPDNEGWRIESKSITGIAQKYGINYLDYDILSKQINFNTDCADSNSHLNPSGARKITHYIGDFISKKYSLIDNRKNEEYNIWNESYAKYMNIRHNEIRNTESIQNYLMLLKNGSLSYGIYLNGDKNWEIYPVVKNLLHNLGMKTKCITSSKNRFIIVNNIGKIQSIIYEKQSKNTYFGKFSLVTNKENILELINSEGNSISLKNIDIGIIVFDNSTLEQVDQGMFVIDDSTANVVRKRE